MNIVEIDAAKMATKDLNEHIRELMFAGFDRVLIKNVCGQRYIGTRLYSHEHKKLDIEIFGTAGNDLGAFLFGHRIIVHGNAQDGVGNTMDDGEIIIEGRAGDVLGMSMRGGKIFVRDNVGYRTGLHMKEYLDKRPIVIIGGTSQDFLGEYMAGGIIILLGLGEKLGEKTHKANFIGTGMHGGVIYLRGSLTLEQLGKEVEISKLDNNEENVLEKYVAQFFEHFPELELKENSILYKDFLKLVPKSSRPYEKLYAY